VKCFSSTLVFFLVGVRAYWRRIAILMKHVVLSSLEDKFPRWGDVVKRNCSLNK